MSIIHKLIYNKLINWHQRNRHSPPRVVKLVRRKYSVQKKNNAHPYQAGIRAHNQAKTLHCRGQQFQNWIIGNKIYYYFVSNKQYYKQIYAFSMVNYISLIYADIVVSEGKNHCLDQLGFGVFWWWVDN